MNKLYSSREIQTVCNSDINFIWLLQGKKATDKFENVITEVGSESEENYNYLSEHNQNSYIKP
ncbi:MAG: hypothetical protein HUJ77_13075 [Clostridium sp.]|nr:hypothetical protein [Clostridium sp.]